MKSTLKRELIERETVERETIEEISGNCDNQCSFERALVTFAVQHGFSLEDKDLREVVLFFGIKCYKLKFLLRWELTIITMLGINGFKRPVLKHGPRSLTYARVFWL